jgi:hypothetical protein
MSNNTPSRGYGRKERKRRQSQFQEGLPSFSVRDNLSFMTKISTGLQSLNSGASLESLQALLSMRELEAVERFFEKMEKKKPALIGTDARGHFLDVIRNSTVSGPEQIRIYREKNGSVIVEDFYDSMKRKHPERVKEDERLGEYIEGPRARIYRESKVISF